MQSTILRVLSSHSPLLLLLIPSILVTACRQDQPGEAPDTTRTSAAPVDTHPSAAMPEQIDTMSGPVTGAPTPAPPLWNRVELTERVNHFINAIDSGDQAGFERMLSSRSRRHIVEFEAQREILNVANEALGRIRNRNIRVLGGTRDSVALLINGNRIEGNDTVATPLIINLLREEGAWKVMYPGLQYPTGHLRK